MKNLKLGEFEIYWLNGGEFELDGGTMFGVVPKVLWSKKYPADSDNVRDDDNYIKLLNYPLLIKTPDSLVLVETGLGNKLTEKQRQIFRVIKDWDLPAELNKLGFTRQDINYVILTHCDFDHAGGIAMYNDDGEEELTFPNAKHIVQKLEWEDVMHPNIRSENTYWSQNYSKLKDTDNLHLVEGDYTVCEGVEVQHTGGHTRGHQVVRIQSNKDIAYHLADLLPTHVHFNPLWIMAYDNFPMEVISLKEKYETKGIRENAWFTYYHDPSMHACKFDIQGHVVKEFATEFTKKTILQKDDIPVQDLNVRKDKKVTLSCPDCLLVREISVDKYTGRKHFLTVNCPCGTTYGVNLNFRKHYRKDVSIGGYYTSEDDADDIGWADAGNVPTVPINCRIKNISMGGLGFTTLSRMRVQVGDKLKVKFTLDKVPPEIVEKEVIVRTIQDDYIGCQFAQESGYTDRTLGFYLMK
ncbi:MAG: MBL fold metallo-hydrolase [Deltaproteobacteria bacterium]|nr:MAG: MBL fold metallo-hydrolase [Deltaproteobacteria bacterium]